MTSDKDDPRFDSFYIDGNEVRLFTSLFLADLPNYVALGFRTRDTHHHPVPNEHYTKLYVFHETEGPKARHGPYIWGVNGALFGRLTRLYLFADEIRGLLRGRTTRWLIHPDPTAAQKVIAWTQAGEQPDFLFIANLDTRHGIDNVGIPLGESKYPLEFAFSTDPHVSRQRSGMVFNGLQHKIKRLEAGEGRVYRILHL
jgi:hypothetical protein